MPIPLFVDVANWIGIAACQSFDHHWPLIHSVAVHFVGLAKTTHLEQNEQLAAWNWPE
jgi:hypothetical protein